METTEKPKRTYQKHKTEKKITVKHYLIDDVETNENGYQEYPVYIQVTYDRKNTKFRSKIPYSLVEIPTEIPVFDNYKSYEECYMTNFENNSERDFRKSFTNEIIRETNFIIWLVNQQIKKRPNEFSIAEIAEIYHSKEYELTRFIESSLKNEIQQALSEIAISEDPDEFAPQYRFPIYHNTSALNNLEFYISKYPQLTSLKKKYSHHIWFIDIYLEQSQFYSYRGFKPIFSMQDPYDYTIISFNPTLYDYITNTFQKCFYSTFEDKQFAQSIIHDIDVLFTKYYANKEH